MRVDEIFRSIQGEGSRRGRACCFVRLTGCPLRCRWCDTAYAFHGGTESSIAQVCEQVDALGVGMVCVTGGEPLAQDEVHALMHALLESGHEVVLETSGALDARNVDERVIRILDLKAPGSGEVERNHWPTFQDLRATDEIKFVLADRPDYEWARQTVRDHDFASRAHCVLFSPVHGQLDARDLAGWMLEDDLPVVLQLQEHKYIWPGVERGI
ncbi:7-carboxy-7-deazaguanine synthase QueE [bacterium]|nr:MAG: 7-carboxy-7-deazaguanine synthase QueE [bacterium]RKZ16909.1 MAG: 7-carboxy-7-deazaguanine synthase QueE [bacterium]